MRLGYWRTRLQWLTLGAACLILAAELITRLNQLNQTLCSDFREPSVSANKDIRKGSLVVKKWTGCCGVTFGDVLAHPGFPNYPRQEEYITRTKMKTFETNNLLWLTGFITPPESGYYKFAITSDDNSELWIGAHENDFPRLAARVGERSEITNGLPGNYLSSNTQLSRSFLMEYDKHYPIDILFHQAVGMSFLEVVWLVPGSAEFQVIESRYLSHNASSTRDINKSSFAVHPKEFSFKTPESHLVHNLDFQLFREVLPYCDITQPGEPLVFEPPAFTDEQKWGRVKGIVLPEGKPLQSTKAQNLAKGVLDAVLKKYPVRYKIVSTYNVEEAGVSDGMSVYLLEMLLDVDGVDYRERFIEYVAADSQNITKLCFPSNNAYRWEKDIDVNVIVVVKNERMWLEAMVNNLEKIYEQTVDLNMNLIIVHFNVTILDTKMKESSSLDRMSVIKIDDDDYSFGRGVNEAVRSIREENSIVLVVQLGVTLPQYFIEDSRKHCLKEIMGYAPIPVKRTCTGKVEPSYEWDTLNLPVIGMHKEDWTRVGGASEQATNMETMFTLLEKAAQFHLQMVRVRRKDLHFRDSAED